MSIHIAVLITSQTCGHCRNMRGSGRLLSQNEIKTQNKQPNIPGKNHYDAKFMKKILTGDNSGASNKQVVRLINVHYKTFNPGEGIMDICIFNLDSDPNNVKQTIMKEKDGKTALESYVIGESGKQISKNDIQNTWSDTVRAYVPINLPSYAFFFPSLAIFHIDAWNNAIQNSKPIYGFVNGLETKQISPYGAIPVQQPNMVDYPIFIGNFFNGSKTLEAEPKNVAPEPQAQVPASAHVEKKVHFEDEPVKVFKPVPEGPCANIRFRLYVKE